MKKIDTIKMIQLNPDGTVMSPEELLICVEAVAMKRTIVNGWGKVIVAINQMNKKDKESNVCYFDIYEVSK